MQPFIYIKVRNLSGTAQFGFQTYLKTLFAAAIDMFNEFFHLTAEFIHRLMHHHQTGLGRNEDALTENQYLVIFF